MNKRESQYKMPKWVDLGDEEIDRLRDLYDFSDIISHRPTSVIYDDNKKTFSCKYLSDECEDMILTIPAHIFSNNELRYIMLGRFHPAPREDKGKSYMRDLKLNDKVKVINKTLFGLHIKIGDVATIIDINNMGSYKLLFEQYNLTQYCSIHYAHEYLIPATKRKLKRRKH